jgi:hypothetical protein
VGGNGYLPANFTGTENLEQLRAGAKKSGLNERSAIHYINFEAIEVTQVHNVKINAELEVAETALWQLTVKWDVTRLETWTLTEAGT